MFGKLLMALAAAVTAVFVWTNGIEPVASRGAEKAAFSEAKIEKIGEHTYYASTLFDEPNLSEENKAYDPFEIMAALMQQTEILDTLPDDVMAHMASYMEEWSGDGVAYVVGDKRQYDDKQPPRSHLENHHTQHPYKGEYHFEDIKPNAKAAPHNHGKRLDTSSAVSMDISQIVGVKDGNSNQPHRNSKPQHFPPDMTRNNI